MRKSLLALTIALAFSAHAQDVLAQAAVGTGGAGGAGGAAQGGTAAGGAATNSNSLTTTGGTGGQATSGTGGSAAGGSASATGVQTGAINSTGNNQAAEVTVNYITPVSPGGLKGLAAGVDPESGHFVNDTNVRYSGTQKIKNTPDASIGGPASGPCNGFSGGIGVSVPGFAVGANTSTVDPGCTARETARIAAMLGRMDIANAVLENTAVVQEALKAKAARMAAAEPPPTPTPTVAPARPNADREVEEARLKEQQRLAVEALQRKATMEKINDTLTFTDAVSQASERTPQQAMAEEATKKLAERTKRAEEQVKLERRLAALKAEPPEQRRNSLEPLVPNMTLVHAKHEVTPAAAPAAPAAAAPAAAPAPATAAPQRDRQLQQAVLEPGEAAKLLRSVGPRCRGRPRSRRDVASQRRFATSGRKRWLFGFNGAKPSGDEVAPNAVRQPVPKATEAAAKSEKLQATRDAPSEKPAGDTKKVPVAPADALNFARAPISVQ